MQAATAKPDFLSHVNGLRALAILGVLFYHLNASWCPAGYFGVDAFLVISGYFLLASLLRAETPGDVHYGSYLLKKSWRILPSWLAVAIIFCVGSKGYLLPLDRVDICSTALRGAFFGADFYIDNLYNYFNPNAHNNLFLHFWYLSITCQMYIILPLLVMLLLCLRSRRLLVAALAVIGLLSFALWVLTTSALLPEAARTGLLKSFGMKSSYYHLLPRLWEVLLGGAVLLLPAWQNRRGLRMLIETLAIAALVASYFCFETGSPQVYTAVIASLLFIRYGGEGPVSRALSWRPVQWIGTISFSLYLWHWPIMAGWKYIVLGQIAWYDEVGMVLLSLALGGTAWALIERLKMPKGSTVWAACLRFAPLALLILFAVSVRPYYKSIRTESNDSVRAQGLLMELVRQFDAEEKTPELMRGLKPGLFEKLPVYIGKDVDAQPSFFLIGDSHASHCYLGMRKYCEENGLKGILFSQIVTPFWYCRKTEQAEWDEEKAEAVMEYIRQHPELETVFIGMLWEPRLHGSRAQTGGVTYDWRKMSSLSAKESADLRDEGLRETCRRLTAMGRKVVLLADVPTLPYRPSPYEQWLKVKMLTGKDCPEYLVPVAQHKAEQKRCAELFAGIVEEGAALGVIDCAEPLRDGEHYRTRNDDNQFYFYDHNHLTTLGSERVYAYVMSEWQRLLREDAAKQPKP